MELQCVIKEIINNTDKKIVIEIDPNSSIQLDKLELVIKTIRCIVQSE